MKDNNSHSLFQIRFPAFNISLLKVETKVPIYNLNSFKRTFGRGYNLNI
jgi:hypothetical protein